MRANVTKCDVCLTEITDAAPKWNVVLGIVKVDGESIDPVTKTVTPRPAFKIDDHVSQKEVCSHGCALAFFKTSLGNGNSER